MGTEEQRAHRAAYAQRLAQAWQGAINGNWTSDSQLNQYLQSLGAKSGSPLYNQLYSGGGYATYGPSWDPTRTFDFEHNQNIMNMGPGQTWYDPSVASNWENTDPLQAARMRGFYNWRDQNGSMIDQKYGGNALVAWLRGRAASGHPNSPDTAGWTGTNYAGAAGAPSSFPSTPTGAFAANPVGLSPADTGGANTSLASFAPATEADPMNDVRTRLKKFYGTSLAGLGGEDSYA